MNECILGLCLYMFGGLGVQSTQENNIYSLGVGELGIRAEMNNTYVQVVHISGINTEEYDWGFNRVMWGVNPTLHSININAGVGVQSKYAHPSNNKASLLFEGDISYMFSNGMYAKAQYITDVHGVDYRSISFGWSSRILY